MDKAESQSVPASCEQDLLAARRRASEELDAATGAKDAKADMMGFLQNLMLSLLLYLGWFLSQRRYASTLDTSGTIPAGS
jgi:hypothetical protein